MTRYDFLESHFSDCSLKIRRLLRDDPDFRELCDDYEDAANALQFSLSPQGRSEKRAREYRSLVAELEAEIETALRKEKPSSNCQG